MGERRGVTNVMLNAVIGLVLIGVTFSMAFFLYRSFSNALTASQVTKGFENFIEPIRQVCQGSDTAFSSDLNLPTWGNAVYGIVQTKLDDYEGNMPLVMRNCEDSYCLCLFKLRKPVRPLLGERISMHGICSVIGVESGTSATAFFNLTNRLYSSPSNFTSPRGLNRIFN